MYTIVFLCVLRLIPSFHLQGIPLLCAILRPFYFALRVITPEHKKKARHGLSLRLWLFITVSALLSFLPPLVAGNLRRNLTATGKLPGQQPGLAVSPGSLLVPRFGPRWP